MRMSSSSVSWPSTGWLPSFIDNTEKAGKIEKQWCLSIEQSILQSNVFSFLNGSCCRREICDGWKNVLVSWRHDCIADAIKKLDHHGPNPFYRVIQARSIPILPSLWKSGRYRRERIHYFRRSPTMPGADETHPIQIILLHYRRAVLSYRRSYWSIPIPFTSKTKRYWKSTREDHGDLANGMIRLYADSKKARELQAMDSSLRMAWKTDSLLHLFEKEWMSET